MVLFLRDSLIKTVCQNSVHVFNWDVFHNLLCCLSHSMSTELFFAVYFSQTFEYTQSYVKMSVLS